MVQCAGVTQGIECLEIFVHRTCIVWYRRVYVTETKWPLNEFGTREFGSLKINVFEKDTSSMQAVASISRKDMVHARLSFDYVNY